MKRAPAIIAALAVCLTLCACAHGAPENTVFSAEDLIGKTVGAIDGSPAESYLRLLGIEPLKYTSEKDMLSDLTSGRIDCAAAEAGVAEALLSSRKIRAIEEPLAKESYSIIVALENPDLTADLNSAIAALKENGTLESLLSICLTGGEYPEYESKEGAACLSAAVDPTFSPYCFRDERGELTGLDVSVARALCAYLGLNLELAETASDKLASAVQNGRASFALGRITADESVQASFTEPYMETSQIILVRKK